VSRAGGGYHDLRKSLDTEEHFENLEDVRKQIRILEEEAW
jgi:hypothetical protein